MAANNDPIDRLLLERSAAQDIGDADDPETEAILADVEREVEDAVAAAVAKARARFAALDAARLASPDR